jgi:hypothetical protein
MRVNVAVLAIVMTFARMGGGFAQLPVSAVPVTADNFPRAESDLYFSNIVKDGGFGKFLHRREPAAIDNQAVIRLNRDTLYSAGVFDLDAGPVTITLPDAANRFMAMQVIDEDQYTSEVVYGASSRTLRAMISISMSYHRRTTEKPSTGWMSRTYRSMASGRSAYTTRKGILSQTASMLTR